MKESSGNELFSYSIESIEFRVEDSCLIDCNKIIFRTTLSRGERNFTECPNCIDLVEGESQTEDIFNSCEDESEKVTLEYSAGSKGNTKLSLNKKCFTGLLNNGIDLPACGPINYFPILTQEEYTQNMSYSQQNILHPTIYPEDFATRANTNQQSKLLWSKNSGGDNITNLFIENDPILTINSMAIAGTFDIDVKVYLKCYSDTDYWNILNYKFNFGNFHTEESNQIGSIGGVRKSSLNLYIGTIYIYYIYILHINKLPKMIQTQNQGKMGNRRKVPYRAYQ